MFKFTSAKSIYKSCVKYLKDNRVVKAKHFRLLDDSIVKTDENVEKLEMYFRQREIKVTGVISKIKAEIKSIKSKDTHATMVTVAEQLEGAINHVNKNTMDGFVKVEKKTNEIEKNVSVINRKLKIVNEYEKNMQELEMKQKYLQKMIDDFRAEVIENRKIKESIRPEYAEIKNDFARQIEDVKTQFTSALATQCQDMIRRINVKIESIGMKANE